MMRRSLLAGLGGGLSAVVLVLAAACGDDDAAPKAAPASTAEAGFDGGLIGTGPTPPSADAQPPPGDVCGNSAGLMADASWPLRGGCTTRAGWSGTKGPTGAAISFTVPLLSGDSSPAITSNSFIWVGTTDGNVVAISNQSVRWGYHTGGAVKSSPVLDSQGRAIVASMDGFLYGFAPTDAPPEQDGGVIPPGDSGITYPPPARVFMLAIGPTPSSPVIGGDGAIYVGTTDGKLLRVKKDGNGTDWAATTNDTLGSSPALGQDGTIYVGSSDHKLYAVSDAGAVKWALDLGDVVSGSPAVGGDGTVYVGTADGKLHAVASGGTERWSYATAGKITGTPAVYAGAVYVGSEDKALHAVSTVSGTMLWKYPTFGAVGTPIIDADGKIYVGAADLHLYAITDKGSLYYGVKLKGNVRTAPAITQTPAIYVATDTGLSVITP